MPRFNHTQTKIALAMMKNSRTVPEFVKATGESLARVERELEEMLKHGLVERTEDEFSLNKKISVELMRRREIEEKDTFTARLSAVVEVQEISEKAVEKHLKELRDLMSKDPEFTIYKIEVGEPVKQEDYYSGFVEVNFSAKNFAATMRFLLLFAPSSIEVIKPPKVEFTAFDFQEGLNDLSYWVTRYNLLIGKHMKLKEIENFNKSVLEHKNN